MAKAFSIRDFMQDARQQDLESDVYAKVSVYDIGFNPKNEYTMSEIEKIKDSIYALGGVQQNVVLVKCPDGADHKYLALDGHRRLTASRELVEEGYAEFEFVPAVIKWQIDNDMEDAMLVVMNSTQRNKTDWERVMEHMRLKEIIPKLKKRQGIDGRARDIEADMLGVSRGQISIYNTIGTRLNAELMKLFENGRIGISLAHEAAKLEPELQEQLAEMAHGSGNICDEDVKRIACSRPIDGQLKILGSSGKDVPESGTSDESGSKPAFDPNVKENVPESGTSEAQQMVPENREKINKNLVEGDKISLTQDKDGITWSKGDAAMMDRKDTPETPVENKGEIQDVKIRGGYEPILIEDLISEYKTYLRMSMDENRDKQICKYNCLLDALELLRKRLLQGKE